MRSVRASSYEVIRCHRRILLWRRRDRPHAVHGFEVMNNGFVLSGKSIDSAGTEEGFVIKFPNNLPDERIFLRPDEEHSFDWVYLFGSP